MQLQKPLIILSALALAGLMLGLTATNLSQSITLGAQSNAIAAISGNSDALREQVKAAGEVPVAPPAKTVVGKPGKDGGQGDVGLPGRPPTADEISYSVAVYCSTRTDCEGSPGAPSTIPGADGQDSTVPGPMGPASTVPGPKGDTGDPGAGGAKGDPGADGADAEPAASYTMATPGGEQTCTRTDPFDKTAPTYECAPTPKETP